jgi:hypothetical protein
VLCQYFRHKNRFLNELKINEQDGLPLEGKLCEALMRCLKFLKISFHLNYQTKEHLIRRLRRHLPLWLMPGEGSYINIFHRNSLLRKKSEAQAPLFDIIL